jgi:tRNA(Ile)-lysidine synthase
MGLFIFQSSINSFCKQEKNYGELSLNEYNQRMVFEEMQRVMKNNVEFQAGTRLLVGVSGGPDSLTLLHGLFHLGYAVTAAHYNHGLRPDAGSDALLVQQVCAQMGIPFVSAASDVAEFARTEGLSIEEAARTVRYRFLFSEARRLGCAAVAVGHTADDQVETVLMHFLRGAGLAGLRGMQTFGVMPEWDADLPLIRPMLGVWRADVLAYCREQALEPVIDQSNTDTTYFRNRLRHELIPYLQDYNPRIKEVLWRMSQTVVGDYDVIEVVTSAAWDRSRMAEGEDFIVLSLPELRTMKTGLQRSVLRKAVARLRPGLRDIDFDVIERAAAFIQKPSSTLGLDLAAGINLYATGDSLFVGDASSKMLLDEWPQLETKSELHLSIPGTLQLPGGWLMVGSWVQPGEDPNWEDAYQVWLDADCLSFPLQVRTRQSGDRFRPLGMQGHSLKLSDFWINARLPRQARLGWPLVCSKGEIVWIPGYRPAETCRIRQDTNRAVQLVLKRETR